MKDDNTVPEGFKMTELGPLPERWELSRIDENCKVKGSTISLKELHLPPIFASLL